MNVVLRLSGQHHSLLQTKLFPGDGKEAVAIALCGRRNDNDRHYLSVHQLHFLSDEDYAERAADRVTWKTDFLVPLLEQAAKRGWAVVKIHSHPGGFSEFSEQDDVSDAELFTSVFGWVDDDLPHASAVMLPDGKLFGRAFKVDCTHSPLTYIAVAGEDLHFWLSTAESEGGDGIGTQEFARRHAQAFGKGTTQQLQRLSIAVVGCSGTGSPVVEQLARLGVGRLLLVDPDHIEEKNLNRILNSTMRDAQKSTPKVEVLRRAIEAMGLGTKVETHASNLFDPEIVKAVAGCDVLFGCMDSVDGRYLLNRLATFYCIPYFDLGVKLQADGEGGVEQICGSVHYLQPGGSSLLSRNVLTLEQVKASGLKRREPEAYEEQLKSKYITGVNEDRPAVISVNMLIASLGVNELL